MRYIHSIFYIVVESLKYGPKSSEELRKAFKVDIDFFFSLENISSMGLRYLKIFLQYG